MSCLIQKHKKLIFWAKNRVFSQCVDFIKNLKNTLGIQSDNFRSVYLKIDVGYHRAGIPNDNSSQILEVAEILAEHSSAIEFQGLYAHCGNSYQGSNDDEVKQARDEAITKLDKVAQVIQDSGLRLLVKHQGTVF